MTIDLLWTNSKPDTAYGAQTLNLSSLSKYSFIIIEFNTYGSKKIKVLSDLIPIGIGYTSEITYRQVNADDPAKDLGRYCWREFSVTSSSIIFRNGNDNGYGWTGEACIPYKVWGVK